MPVQKPVFKPYYQGQIMAIPPTLDELVAKGHPVRIVNDIINRINIQGLLDAYKIKGTSSYHPQYIAAESWRWPAGRTSTFSNGWCHTDHE